MPDGMRACRFDLAGAPTQTDVVHAAAWQETSDAFLRRHADRTGPEPGIVDLVSDYGRYSGGTPLAAGARSFLAATGIEAGRTAHPAGALRREGADVVMSDLANLLARQ
jgi:hypothetical protein